MTNGSITDRYTLYTLIVRVLHALYWKVGRENKRKQIGILRHIVLIISDLQKQDLRFQQRLKLCSGSTPFEVMTFEFGEHVDIHE